MRCVGIVILAAGAWLLGAPERGENRPALPLSAAPGLRAGISADFRMTARLPPADLLQAISAYEELTGRTFYAGRERAWQTLDRRLGFRLSRAGWIKRHAKVDHGMYYHADGIWRAGEVKQELEGLWRKAGLVPRSLGTKYFVLCRSHGQEAAPETKN